MPFLILFINKWKSSLVLPFHRFLEIGFSKTLWTFRRSCSGAFCHLQRPNPGFLLCTFHSNLFWQLKPPKKVFSCLQKEKKIPNILHSFGADWTSPVHLWCDRVFGYWIQYLVPQAASFYQSFHKAGQMGQLSQPCALFAGSAQPVPDLCLPRTQAHGRDQTTYTFALWTTAASWASLDQIFTYSYSITPRDVHMHTYALIAHTICLWCPIFSPPPPVVSPVFISVDTFPLIHGAAWLPIKWRMDIFL